MAFVQIMDFRTLRPDELRALDEEWLAATTGKRTLRRWVIAQDRSDPAHHMIVAFFDSFESVMQNFNLPETQAFAKRLNDIVDGPVTSHGLEIIEDRS